MNIEDVKIGETYYVPFTVKAISDKYVTATTGGTLEALLLAKTLHPIPSAPKYDPCRPFREGDRVREVLVKGRRYDGGYPECFMSDTSTVVTDEDYFHFVTIKHPNGEQHSYDAAYLELVTPVEELESYSVEEDKWYWHVLEERNGGKITVCKFCKDFHPHAKEASEAECARLNAECRKEK